ncbi:MAG: DNA alkylation repair protein, partial [Planctomycetes bacterium]|nr:DNA alkylation repair protein [Planctomycetota bacterium]
DAGWLAAVPGRLAAMADPRYREFHRRITPGIHDFLGVRVPGVRALAKEILRRGGQAATAFLERRDFSTYESTMLYGLVAAGRRAPFAEKRASVREYVRHIDNWALCDVFCAALKDARREPGAVWEFLRPYAASRQEFPARFALVMYLDYFLDDPGRRDAALAAFARPIATGYNVKMAAAWGLSAAFVKCRAAALAVLRAPALDPAVRALALQKIRDSRRVPAADKAALRTLVAGDGV